MASETFAVGTSDEEQSTFATAALERVSRYRQKVYYVDPAGLEVNGDETRIQWWWDGTCALGGTTDQIVTYKSSTGWQLWSRSGGESETCSRYLGETKATFRNAGFCSVIEGWVDPVWVYYYYNRVYGRYNGGVTLRYSSDTSASCITLAVRRSYGTW